MSDSYEDDLSEALADYGLVEILQNEILQLKEENAALRKNLDWHIPHYQQSEQIIDQLHDAIHELRVQLGLSE